MAVGFREVLWLCGLGLWLGCMGEATLGGGRGDLIPATVVCVDASDPSTCRRCDECTLATPLRIRRLTHAELDASAQALLGTTSRLSSGLPNEFRANGYTRNDGQVVDSMFAQSLDASAALLAKEAVTQRLSTLVPCAGGLRNEDCARTFISRFAPLAFRRPATDAEKEGLVSLWREGLDGGDFATGIEWVIRAVLQSSGFLYVTELGREDAVGPRRLLTQHEIASAIAFLISGGPPDAELLAAAEQGQLSDAAVRRAQAKRLMVKPESRRQLETLVLEWLGLDALNGLDKDADLFPTFQSLRPDMLTEARALVADTFVAQQGTVAQLLGRPSSVVTAPLAEMYGLPPVGGPLSLQQTPRRGILTSAAFLSVYASPTESAPIRRGVAVLRRVLCHAIPDPSELNIQVVPPPPDDTLTTRQRFSQHSTDVSCRGCHGPIDAVGFAFEGFDAMGRVRTEEAGQAIDSSGNLPVTSIAGAFSGSVELLERLAPSPEATGCFARQVFRYASARRDATDEAAFLTGWSILPETRKGNPLDVLLAYVETTGFIVRSQTP
jgi:hypothetical protein